MKLHNGKTLIFFLLVLGLSVAGCVAKTNSPTVTLSPEPTITQTSTALATAYAQQPAAGICASTEGETVVITLNTDMPDPRCSKVRADQMLKVINNTPSQLVVSIGNFKDNLAAGEEFTVDKPFGEYLAPGVHQLNVTPCCGAEIWLEEK